MSKSAISKPGSTVQDRSSVAHNGDFSSLLTEDLLYRVNKPGQYLGNEWGAAQRDFNSAEVRLCLAFPDIYELGMSNFGQRILYQIVNKIPEFMCDRTYAPGSDLEALLRERGLPLWGWESRQAITSFELVGFSLQYELCYTNVLNLLDMSGIPVFNKERTEIFPLLFAGGPSTVNPEPMADFLDFFIIGDGEEAVPNLMKVVQQFKREHDTTVTGDAAKALRHELLVKLAKEVQGVYVPALYKVEGDNTPPKPIMEGIPERVARQVMPLNNDNQPAGGIVPYLNLVHDRQVLEVRRGCDRGCRFCQPGYTFLPVRERSTEDLLEISKKALDTSGYQEYSLLSLCVSDYTSLHETVRTLNREHMSRRASMSFPSQRADRMNFEVAEELKAVRKSGITLAPEAGTERLRAVINKGLSHQQIISAIRTAYESGWSSVKLYYMIGLPTERDEDLQGIVDTLKEATELCRALRRLRPEKHNRDIEFTCTMSNFVPKPHTPFQWYGQTTPKEFARKQTVMRDMMRESRLRNVKLNFTGTNTSLLESVISRGDRRVGELIYRAWKNGCTFDAWDDRLQFDLWEKSAAEMGLSLEELSCTDREVGSAQPWDVVNIGLAGWWLVNEWKKALAVKETAPCSENTCHACGVCTDLDTTHVLANPPEVVLGKNPFVKKLEPTTPPKQDDNHPSLQFQAPPEAPPNNTVTRIVFEFKKTGELRFVGHLDLQHLLIRAARRAKIYVAYSEGFNPSPKVSLALSLSLYSEGLAEVGEFELSEDVSADEFVARMNAQLPPDVQILRARAVPTVGRSIAQAVGRATYRATPIQLGAEKATLDAASIEQKLSEILALPSLEIEKIEKEKKGGRSGRHGSRGPAERKEPSTRDIRPGIYSLKVLGDSAGTVELELAHGPRSHVKPSDVLKFVATETDWRITRVGLATDNGTPLFDA